LAEGIACVLRDGERWETLSRKARKKVEQEFELKHIVDHILFIMEKF